MLTRGDKTVFFLSLWKRGLLFCVVLSVFFISCSGEKNSLRPYPQSFSEQKIERSCSRMNILSNLLDYESFKWASICWGWDVDYPHFYNAFLKINPDAWNHVMGPLDKFFFNDRSNRNKYLKLFNNLEKNGILDDFEVFLGSINKNNMNDLIFNVLKRSFDGGDKSPLMGLMDIFSADEESLKFFIELSRATIKVLEGENKNLNVALKDVISEGAFTEKRIALVDEMFRALLDGGLNTFDRHFIRSLLSYKGENGEHWMHDWIKSQSQDPTLLQGLLTYEDSFHSGAKIDFSNILQLGSTILCSSEDGRTDYLVDAEGVLRGFVTNLAAGDFISFLSFLNKEALNAHIADRVCNIRELFDEQGTSLGTLMSNVFGTIDDRESHLFFQRIHQNLLKTEKKTRKRDSYYLIKKYLGGLGREAQSLGHYLIIEKKSRSIHAILNVLAGYSKQDYTSFLSFIEILLEKENVEILRDVGEVWLNLKNTEKEYLVQIVDVLFKDDFHYINILKIAQVFIDDFRVFIPLLGDKVAKNEAVKMKTLSALLNISGKFKGEKVLGDLRKIFSRREILKTLKVLSGLAFSGEQPLVGKSILGNNDFSDILGTGGYDPSALSNLRCSNYLSQEKISFDDLIYVLPHQCSEIEDEYFPVKFLKYLGEVNQQATDFGYGPIFTEEGLGSKEIAGEIANAFVLLKSKGRIKKIIDSLDFTKKVLFLDKDSYPEEKSGISFVENALNFSHILFRDNSPSTQDYRSFLKQVFMETGDAEIFDYISNAAKILRNYGNYYYYEPRFHEKYSCRSLAPHDYRLSSCPEKDFIKGKIKRIVDVLGRRYEGKKSSIEYLLESIDPDVGLKIKTLSPKGEEEYINYVIDLRNYLLYAHDGISYSDQVRFYTGLNKKKDYFDSVMNNAQKMDVVVRDSGFYGNYFGLHYLNNTVHNWDYLTSVQKSLSLFKRLSSCVNAPVCRFISPIIGPLTLGRWKIRDLPLKGRFWSLNIVNTFSTLTAVADNYSHGKFVFSYDRLMKAFLSIFVHSSPDEAQFTNSWTKFTDKYMDIHNGRVILDMAEMSSFQNMARFTYDRFSGYDRDEFHSIVFGDEFERVNKRIFKGIASEQSKEAFLNILNKHSKDNGAISVIVDAVVDFLAQVPYGKQRVMETVLADILVIISYLGEDHDDAVFKKFGGRYAANNIFNHVNSLESILLLARGFIENAPKDMEIVNLLHAIRAPVRFLRDSLSKRDLVSMGNVKPADVSARRELFYVFLNDTFQIFQTLMAQRSFVGFSEFLLGKATKSPEAFWKSLQEVLVSLGRFMTAMHYQGEKKHRGDLFKFSDTLSFYSSEKGVRSKNLRKHIASMDMAKLMDYFLQPSKADKERTNIHTALRQILQGDEELLKSYMQRISDMIASPGEEKGALNHL